MKQSPALESKMSSQQSTGSKKTTINPCQQKQQWKEDIIQLKNQLVLMTRDGKQHFRK